MGRNSVTAARHTIRVNARSITLAGNLSPGAAPCVVQRVPRIKVARGRSRRCGLAHHDLTWIDGATCGNRRPRLSSAKHEYQSTLQPCASDICGGNNRRRAKLMIRENEIGSDQAQSEVSTQI